MTSINPFSQFIVRELVNQDDEGDKKYWQLDQKLMGRAQPGKDEENLKSFSSAEMFSIYNYSKDITMQVKSDRYTGGEWKKLLDLVSIEENLLISSQISNQLLAIKQQEKMMQEAQQKREGAGATDGSPAKKEVDEEKEEDDGKGDAPV